MKYGRFWFLGAAACCALFLAPSTLCAQGQWLRYSSSSKPSFSRRIEAGVAGYYQFSKLQSSRKVSITDHDYGLNAYGGLWLTPWLLVGGEYGCSFTKPLTPVMQDLELSEAGAIVKLNLTPNMLPKQYILLGAGKKFWNYHLQAADPQSGTLTYYRAGFGLETALWDKLLLGAQWRVTYLPETDLGPFVQKSTRWEHAAQLYISLLL